MKKFLFSMVACGLSSMAAAVEPYYEYETCTNYPQYNYTQCTLFRFLDGSAPSKNDCESYVAGLNYPPSVCSQGSGGWYLGYWDAGGICNQGNGHCTAQEKPFTVTHIFSKYCELTDGLNTEDLSKRLCQGSTDSCCPINDRFFPAPPSCPSEGERGNPVNVLTGTKKEVIELLPATSLPPLSATFDSTQFSPREESALHPLLSLPPSFGKTWQSSMHHRLIAYNKSGLDHLARAVRGGQPWVGFKRDEQGNYSTPSVTDWRLERLNGSGWRLTDTRAAVMETYNTAWRQIGATSAAGATQVYTYSTSMIDGQAPVAGLLIGVSDHFGRSISLFYELGSNNWGARIYRIIGADGQETRIGYDGENNVASITWPDGNIKQFLYERPDLPWALTGSVDEAGQRYSNFDYDPLGRAISTEHASGSDKHSVTWTKAPNWGATDSWDPNLHIYWRDHYWTMPEGMEVTGPLGDTTTLQTTPVHGMPRPASSTQPGGSGCDASSSSLRYDSNGNVTSRVDFNGRRSCHAYKADRNVETYRVEGLVEADACPADLASYQISGDLPADAPQRKITTEWHPLWNLKVRKAEPKLITTTVYNGYVDPVDPAHPTLDCAAGAPLLPDGSKIAVVCKRYEQSTNDETGNLGTAALPIDTRSWSYSYNQYGQMVTETDPRNKTTTSEYWPAPTSFVGDVGHTLGDLVIVTNALGQKTQYTEYNKRGQPLTIQAPNGSIEKREYHMRGWLTKVVTTPAGSNSTLTTLNEYYPTGLLKQVTQPDGSFTAYFYDAAHRLTSVKDTAGNTVAYELDNMGNVTKETYTDLQQVVFKTIERSYDALGRLQSIQGAP